MNNYGVRSADELDLGGRGSGRPTWLPLARGAFCCSVGADPCVGPCAGTVFGSTIGVRSAGDSNGGLAMPAPALCHRQLCCHLSLCENCQQSWLRGCAGIDIYSLCVNIMKFVNHIVNK